MLTSDLIYTENSRHKNLIKGLEIISENIIAEKVTILNVISTSFGNDPNDFRNLLMQSLMEKSLFRIRQQFVDHISTLESKQARKFAVIIIEKFKHFQHFLSKFNNEFFRIHGHFVFILINGAIPEIPDILKECFKRDYYNLIILYENENARVPVITFLPYQSSTDCLNTSAVIVNEFVNGSFTKELENMFIDKMQDLKQCSVRIATTNTAPPHMMIQKLPNGTEVIKGRDFELLSALSESLNFKLNFTYIGSAGYTNNGTLSGSFGELQKGRADVSAADWWLSQMRLEYVDASTSYFSENLVFLIPSASELTSIEKLMYPLTFTSWMVFISFITIGLFVIFLVKKQSLKVQSFIIGRNVRNPYLNIVIGLFGQNQLRLPKRNFARFLLMSYLLFSLVLRTVYQGKMFELLKMNMRHSEPNTIQDMIDGGYEVLIPDTNVEIMASRKIKYRVAW